MSVLDELLADTQPNYAQSVRAILLQFLGQFGDAAFEGIGKDEVADRVLDRLPRSETALATMIKLGELNWWCGLPISTATHGRMAALARAIFADVLARVPVTATRADRAALRRHTVFIGGVVDELHSPTRGAIAYARALAANPEVEAVEVVHTRPIAPGLQAHIDGVLGPLAAKITFEEATNDRFLVRAIQGPQRTYHVWCESPFVLLTSFLSLFGPTVSFQCADGAPVQYADVFWYAHEPEQVAARWGPRGAPARFVANYRQVETVPFTSVPARQARTREALGLAPDDIVLATVGNRIGVEMDQAYVEGMAAFVVQDPRRKWLFVGALQQYWINTFEAVLGDQFQHVPLDLDLPSRFAHVDIFANPFRAGGGNTAIMAMEAGCVVLTRGDLGDVPAFVPAHHRTHDAASYFERLAALVDDADLRATWRAEQAALIGRFLDPQGFEAELAQLSQLAFERFRARTPVQLAPVLAPAA